MIYSWPKGRVIRTILTAVALGIGADFGIAAWGNYQAWAEGSGGVPALVTLIVYAVLMVVSLIGGPVACLFHPKSSQFLIEVEKELVKVTWPKRPDVIRSTIVIAILTVILALFIFAVDYINAWVVYDNLLAEEGTS